MALKRPSNSIPSGSTTNPSTSSKSSAPSAESAAKLTDFEALTFDCYGTLIDWESGIIEALKPLTARRRGRLRATKFSRPTRAMNSRSRPDAGEALSRAAGDRYRRLAEEWGVATSWSDCALMAGRSGTGRRSPTPLRRFNT